VTYHFTPARPGTYYYHSATNMDTQLLMGLFGALIVRPAGYNPADTTTWRAYNDNASGYNREFLFLVSEMDDLFNTDVETGKPVDTTTFFPVYWFINGRTAMDTLAPDRVPYLPTQPYGSMAMMHPGDNVLLRIVNMGHDLHPFHTHGNHARIIARDGRLRSTNEGVAGADLSELAFSVTTAPGRTVDAIFQWTGENLGWDVYGHTALDNVLCNGTNGPGAGFDPVTREYCPDHTLPFPVAPLDQRQEDIEFGPWFSGSPFLGKQGFLPPGVTRFNLNGGFFLMWHSHNEKELTNNDVFPGGLLTFMDVEPPWIDIPEVP
jgi:FtsP/CotA-like multicopper oxidase with cupredoxin domain